MWNDLYQGENSATFVATKFLNIGDGNPSHPNPRQINEGRVIRRICKECAGCDKSSFNIKL